MNMNARQIMHLLLLLNGYSHDSECNICGGLKQDLGQMLGDISLTLSLGKRCQTCGQFVGKTHDCKEIS